MKSFNLFLNSTMGAFIGVFVGLSGNVVWQYKTHPELYAMQSAPWYTSILVYGAVTLAVLVICMVLKLIIKCRKKTRNEAQD